MTSQEIHNYKIETESQPDKVRVQQAILLRECAQQLITSNEQLSQIVTQLRQLNSAERTAQGARSSSGS